MFTLTGVIRDYAWGSPTVIPEFLGQPTSGAPVAEVWFGAHGSGASPVPAEECDLAALIARDPRGFLGGSAMERFGEKLPFLVKLIAPRAPLSLQVHPNLDQARDGYARARAGGADAPVDYVDANHKPELLYPLTDFEALGGFRPVEETMRVLDGLQAPVLDRTRELLARADGGAGRAFAHLLQEVTAKDVMLLAEQCAARLEAGTSPSPHSDEIVGRLQHAHPGDPGVVVSLLLTPLLLRPGEVMFIPAGVVHVYLSGLGVEVLANSDNVLRAGLTHKHVDVPELLRVLDPNGRAVIPEPTTRATGITGFPCEVEDFEVTIIDAAYAPARVDCAGPRILLGLSDSARVSAPAMGAVEHEVGRGQAVFVPDSVGAVVVTGGRVLHAGVVHPR